MPMTSPVLFISGPRMMSVPGNLLNGNTASLTATWSKGGVSWTFRSSRLLPAMTLAAILAQGTPVALPTKGTVRLARGLTSMT